MRVIGEIPNDQCKITLFNWNEKYLIKFEIGMYEQTYKIDEYEIAGVDAVKKLITADFVKIVMARFDKMHNDWASLIS